MSEKMECPGCGSCTSSILERVGRGEPCPYCGLSAFAVTEIHAVQRTRADEGLKARLAEALAALDRAAAEAGRLRAQVTAARKALGCEEGRHP